jgi:hypothetical protein
MKRLIFTSLAFLTTSMLHAGASSLAIVKQDYNDNQIVLSVSVNNQANLEITSDSNLIPSDAKVIAAQGAKLFEITIPNEAGTKRVRYSNENSGCDFYIDTQGGAMPGSNMTFITGVPISSDSMCNVFTSGGVNHLAVSFQRFNP